MAVNTNQIVPVTKIDLISLYGLILKRSSVSADNLDPSDNEGNYSCGTGTKLATTPLKSCNFTGSSGTIYFVPAVDYVGFTRTGGSVTMSGTLTADGCSLYSASLSSGTVTLTKISL